MKERLLQLDIGEVLDRRIHENLQPAERSAMLEVAYLAIAADGKLVDEELEAFAQAMLLLFGPDSSPDMVKHAVAELVSGFERGDDQARLAELAADLERPYARDQTYKLAYAMAMSDLDTDDQEFAFDQRLRRALGLSDEQAERLIDSIIDAINPVI
jgi:tellurite resistance protein